MTGPCPQGSHLAQARGRKMTNIETLGQLKESGYQPLGVKAEMRKNLIR